MNRYSLFLLCTHLTKRSVSWIMWYRTNSEQLVITCRKMLYVPSWTQTYSATVLLKVCQYPGNY